MLVDRCVVEVNARTLNVTVLSSLSQACHSPAPHVLAEWTLDWEKQSMPSAYGRCESLYETDPKTKQRVGEPVADCFGTIAYPDGCALALADGVSWGQKPRCAARRAVYGALKGLNAMCKQLQGRTVSSHEVFNKLLEVSSQWSQLLHSAPAPDPAPLMVYAS